jgi:hypothetical protein
LNLPRAHDLILDCVQLALELECTYA